MSLRVDFSLSWLSSGKLSPSNANTLLVLIKAVQKNGSLKAAAEKVGVSYRFAWGLLGDASSKFGAPIVEMQRGQGARLTIFGEKLLWADRLIREALDPQFNRLRHEVQEGLAKALPQYLPHLIMHASHDLALAELPALCAGHVDLEIVFRSSDECLEALANDRCDLAGFHVADALPRAAAAAAALGRWLDPGKHSLIHFITREQGLIASPKSNIRSVNDLTRHGVRFINRQSGSNPAIRSNEELSVAAAVAHGNADAAFGLRADAARYGLDFVPLAVERYFLAFHRSAGRTHGMRVLLDVLRGRDFSSCVAGLPGYDTVKAGKRAELDAALNWVGKPLRASRRTQGDR